MPCPIGTLPIVEPDQYGGRSPALSPGKSMPVGRPKPKRWIQSFRRDSPSFVRAIVTAPTFDERCRIWDTVIRSVGRLSASCTTPRGGRRSRSEEHTSELQSRVELGCPLLLEKK